MSRALEVRRPECFNQAPRKRLESVADQPVMVEPDATGYLRLRTTPVRVGEVFYTLSAHRWHTDPASQQCQIYRSREHILLGYNYKGCRWAQG